MRLRVQSPDLLSDLGRAEKTPGIAAVIRRNGMEMYSRVICKTDLDRQIEVTHKTRFQIGSLFKLITTLTSINDRHSACFAIIYQISSSALQAHAPSICLRNPRRLTTFTKPC